MATLPDLATATIGYVAFWNAINDGGVADIDPEEALTDGSIIEYTLYDNGWAGTYAGVGGAGFGDPRTLNVRVKEDGWIVAYIDRTNTFAQDVDDPADLTQFRGYVDMFNDWSSETDNTPRFDRHTLERAINSLASQMANFGGMTYNVADVGLYNYEFSGAVGSTGLAAHNYQPVSGINTSYGHILSPGTTFLWGATFGRTRSRTFNSNAEVTYEGTRLARTGKDFLDHGFGTISHAGLGTTVAATEYQSTQIIGTPNPEFHRTYSGVLVIWS